MRTWVFLIYRANNSILFSFKVKALQAFSARLKGLKEVDDELAKWDLKFGNVCQFKGIYMLIMFTWNCCLFTFLDCILCLSGRTLPPENLISGPKSKKTSYKEDNAEWNTMFRSPYQLYGPTSCQKWAVLYNQSKIL